MCACRGPELVQSFLSSGRVAILGYTMPIWVVIFSIALDKAVLTRKEWLGILATTVGIAALLWDEFAQLTGKPFWVGAMLVTAAAWGLGTLELRRKPAPAHISSTTITFWMLCVASVVIITGSIALERPQWRYPNQTEWWAVAYTSTAAIAFAHVAFTHLARTLPSVTLSLSMMLIPIVGVFSGAWLLGESVRAADWVALCAVVLAMWAVLNRKKTN